MKKGIILSLTAAAFVLCSTQICSAEDKTTITLWHQSTTTSDMDQIAASYMELHPEIEINAVSMKTQDQNKTLKMALTSGDGPDIFYYDAGPGYMGALADAGLLLPLDDYAEQYGWNDKIAGWALNACVRDGKLWGIASEYEMLCVFYNKEIFETLGVEVPTTYNEFVHICEVAKENGIVGLELDDLEQWPGYHYESLFMGAFGGPDMLAGVLDQSLEGGFDQPELAAGLNALAALVKDGYTSEFPNGIAHDDALRDFYTGGAAMYLTGTWQVSSMYENMGDNVGIFVFPSASEDIITAPPVGVGSAMQVSSATEHPDEVAAFLDYIYTADGGAKIWMKEAQIITPCDVDTSDMEFNPLFLDVIDISQNVDVYNYNLDVLMPANVNDATANYIQQIIDGVMTGEEAVALKQSELEKAIENGDY